MLWGWGMCSSGLGQCAGTDCFEHEDELSNSKEGGKT